MHITEYYKVTERNGTRLYIFLWCGHYDMWLGKQKQKITGKEYV